MSDLFWTVEHQVLSKKLADAKRNLLVAKQAVFIALERNPSVAPWILSQLEAEVPVAEAQVAVAQAELDHQPPPFTSNPEE